MTLLPPRPLRLLTFACALVALTAASFAVGGADARSTSSQSVSADNALEAAILVELNVVRRGKSLRPLRISKPLAAAADAHSLAMARFGFFAHDSRDGSSFGKRLRRFYTPRGYATWSGGENLLYATPGLDARKAVAMWMQSPMHRKNILHPAWREIGLSAVAAGAAPGVFGGRDVVLVTTVFGART